MDFANDCWRLFDVSRGHLVRHVVPKKVRLNPRSIFKWTSTKPGLSIYNKSELQKYIANYCTIGGWTELPGYRTAALTRYVH
eukprot:1336843-Amorphochlora_amoeboformis.AAC.1